jgi:hypothetical protein
MGGKKHKQVLDKKHPLFSRPVFQALWDGPLVSKRQAFV